MKKHTLGSAFGKIRHDKGKSLLAVAASAAMSEAAVWKIENDQSVRWETVHLALVAGLGVERGSSTYQRLHGLWAARCESDAAGERLESKWKVKVPPHTATAIREFRKIATGVHPRKLAAFMVSVREVAAKHGITPGGE